MKNLLLLLLLCSSELLHAQHVIGPVIKNVANTNFHGPMVTSTQPTGTISPTSTPACAAQWSFLGQGTIYDGTTAPSDWIYSIVSTAKKEYVACGYSKNNVSVPSGQPPLSI